MFASLGGESNKPASPKALDPNDEFHLGSIEDEKLEFRSTGDISGIQDIMDRHPVQLEELNQLQGSERDEASSRLYRKHALREKQLSNWVRAQCGTLFDEYQDCLKNTSLRMPFFSCSTEYSAYAHCIDVTKKATRVESKKYYASQNVVWNGWLSTTQANPEEKQDL